ncbi:MAG: hypothetical protein LBP96_01055 [Bacteroidales bacterium]|jgi:hypothetical protein|nr:hypothetical protein [Bacteroidales bacterium]
MENKTAPKEEKSEIKQSNTEFFLDIFSNQLLQNLQLPADKIQEVIGKIKENLPEIDLQNYKLSPDKLIEALEKAKESLPDVDFGKIISEIEFDIDF